MTKTNKQLYIETIINKIELISPHKDGLPKYIFCGDSKVLNQKWAFKTRPFVLEKYIEYLKEQLKFAEEYRSVLNEPKDML